MSTQSWQIPCPRCGWANSGALTKCAKCGQPLAVRPGLLVAGQAAARPTERPVASKVAKPGGIVPRLVALVIDTIILAVLILPLYSLWASQVAPVHLTPGSNLAAELQQRQLSLQAAVLAVTLFYFAGSWAMTGGTPGQLAMSLRVTDANAAGIGFFRAVLRWAVFFFLGVAAFGMVNGIVLFLLLPFLLVNVVMVMVSKNHRALHDLLGGTFVIQVVDRPAADSAATEATPAPPAGASPPPPKPAAPDPAQPAQVYSPPAPTTGSAPIYSPPPAGGRPPSTYSPPQPAQRPPASPPPVEFPPIPMVGPQPAPPSNPAPPAPESRYSPPPMPPPSGAPERPPAPPGDSDESAPPPHEFPPMAPPAP